MNKQKFIWFFTKNGFGVYRDNKGDWYAISYVTPCLPYYFHGWQIVTEAVIRKHILREFYPRMKKAIGELETDKVFRSIVTCN